MTLPGNPCNYKTRRGLFNGFVRALSCAPTMARAFWLTNATWYAETEMPDLLPQLRRLREEASPKRPEQLIPVGHSFGV